MVFYLPAFLLCQKIQGFLSHPVPDVAVDDEVKFFLGKTL